LNTNGFNPGSIKELARCGLNSVRISINSFNKARYDAYYKPCGYKLRDVLNSIRQAKKSGLFVSLNYLTFPGFTDSEEEVNLLLKFLKTGSVDFLQLRNLSIDPEFFMQQMPRPQGKPLGMLRMIAKIKACCPKVRLGYFNLSKNKFML
jgi:pyruvate-formate lyase-activating enzyme